MAKTWIKERLRLWQESTRIDFNYFFRSGTWSLLGDGAQVTAGLGLAVLFARLASRDTFGQYQLLVSVVALVAAVSIKGLDNVILRDAARSLDGVYSRAVRLRFWWSLLAVPIMLIAGYYYGWKGEDEVRSTFYFSAWLVPLFYVFSSWTGWLKGKQRFDLQAKYTVVRALLNLLIVGGVVVISRANLIAVFGSYLAVQIVMNSIIFGRSLKLKENDKVSGDWKEYSYFISVAGLFKLAVANIDKILVAIIISPAALAVYTIAILIPNYFQLAIKSVFQTTAPRLSRRKYLSFKELVIVLGTGIILAIICLGTVRFLLLSLFGESYVQSLRLAYIASFSMIFHPVALYISNFINMAKKKKAIAIGSTVCPILKLGLLVWLVSVWQEAGFVAVYALMSLVWAVVPLLAMRIDNKRKVVF